MRAWTELPRAPGAEWIDELATAARDRLSEAAGEVVVAHSDWRTEHVRFERREIVSTYDWQSLAVGTEPALIGQIGHTFTVDLGIEQRRRRPTLAGFSAFVADYESARCRSFTGAERKAIDAAWVYAIAYGARCEHSDLVLIWNLPKADIAQDSFTGLLARHGAQLLG